MSTFSENIERANILLQIWDRFIPETNVKYRLFTWKFRSLLSAFPYMEVNIPPSTIRQQGRKLFEDLENLGIDRQWKIFSLTGKFAR